MPSTEEAQPNLEFVASDDEEPATTDVGQPEGSQGDRAEETVA